MLGYELVQHSTIGRPVILRQRRPLASPASFLPRKGRGFSQIFAGGYPPTVKSPTRGQAARADRPGAGIMKSALSPVTFRMALHHPRAAADHEPAGGLW
jgi:hypothetical protein